MNIKDLYTLYKQSYTVSTDTRNITEGCMFFALKGEHFNGNEFAEEALKKGASYAIIDENEHQTNPNILLVDDVLAALQALAKFHRKTLKTPIISLTGSNGKTTTKELINTVLSTTYHTTATLGNLNNHIGVPLTLLSMTPETEIGIVEMGANHLKEIDFLCDIAFPDYGYITNFGKAHLEGFGSLEGVIKGKTELYKHLRKRDKTVFVNANDTKQLEESATIQRITFGADKSDVVIKMKAANPFVIIKYNELVINSKLIGAYNYNNIAAAIAIGNYFSIDATIIKKAIEKYTPTNNRSQIIKKGDTTIILDAYNANPSSMEAALKNISGLTDTNKIVVLGDMFELGKEAADEHQKIVDLITTLSIDNAFLIGEYFFKTTTDDATINVYKTFDDFKNQFIKLKLPKATLLIKASRGMALERVLDLL